MTDGGASVRVDGRTARAERTRRAIVDALLELISEGDLKASPERIVERAGVSLRTLWTNFKDLEGLYAAAGRRLMDLMDEQYRPLAPEAPLTERVPAFCEQRARMLELVAPAARAAALRLPFSAQLQRNQAAHHARTRTELAEVFATELADAPGPEELIRALMVVTGWPAWSMLRDDLGLTVADATAVMARGVGALVGSASDLHARSQGSR